MADPRLHVGTSGWKYPDRVGYFYPLRTLPRDFLAYASQHFGAAEIDSIFCRIPTAKRVNGWNAVTRQGFLFTPRVPLAMTHEKRFQECAAELYAFLSVMPRLGPKLVLLNNHFRGHGPATARALLGKLAGVAS